MPIAFLKTREAVSTIGRVSEKPRQTRLAVGSNGIVVAGVAKTRPGNIASTVAVAAAICGTVGTGPAELAGAHIRSDACPSRI